MDPTPIYNPGAPRTTGGINNAAHVCGTMEIDLTISPPTEEYVHCWEEECHYPRPVIGPMELAILDKRMAPSTLHFDLVQGDYTLIIGLDVGKFASQNNIDLDGYITIKRPSDTSQRTFTT